MPHTARNGSSRPLIFGEVLLDQFPSGRSVVGGAPFNVAWDLKGLGADPLMVSAVGKDAEAEQVCSAMADWEMDSSGIQQLAQYQTGRVAVSLNDGQPSYEIVPNCAYDFIDPPEFGIVPERFSVFYYGSLCARNAHSRQTLFSLIESSSVPRFVDLNIRDPWFDHEWIPTLVNGATWVKLNDEELGRLADCPKPKSKEEIVSAVDVMRGNHGGQTYFITCGSSGAWALPAGGKDVRAVAAQADSAGTDLANVRFVKSPSVEDLQDTVGAGDAFSAATIHSLLQGYSPEQSLSAGTRLAARVCTIRGATSQEKSLYQQG